MVHVCAPECYAIAPVVGHVGARRAWTVRPVAPVGEECRVPKRARGDARSLRQRAHSTSGERQATSHANHAPAAHAALLFSQWIFRPRARRCLSLPRASSATAITRWSRPFVRFQKGYFVRMNLGRSQERARQMRTDHTLLRKERAAEKATRRDFAHLSASSCITIPRA